MDRPCVKGQRNIQRAVALLQSFTLRESRMMMKNSIFRKKSMDRVSSPEQLNDYIRVTSPGVWLFLIALILLLTRFIIWAAFGRLDVVTADGSVQSVAPITFVTN